MAEIGATTISKHNAQQAQTTEKTIYIGVFFDGTGNNKYQVTMGKLFRMKEALAKAEGKSETQVNINLARGKGRDYWKNKLTKSQLDELFFGYEGSNDKDIDFIERRIDSVHTTEVYGPPNAEALKLRTYQKAAEEFHSKALFSSSVSAMSDPDWKQLKKSSGSGGSQGDTYTNVAILEALYKSDDINYFPIYVEGAGTDMDMSKNQDPMNFGGAGGMGDLGVWAKVRHARDAVTRICQRFTLVQKTSSLTVHLSIYGFSRGATEARMFAHIFDPHNTKSKAVNKALKEISRTEFLNEPQVKKHLDFVGIFDTVSSQGFDFSNDVDDLHLYGVSNADYTLHLCAMDEYRNKFALTDIQSAWAKGLELFLPGCHTDVGGGFSIGVDDWRSIDSKHYHSLAKVWQTYILKEWNRRGDSDYRAVSVDTLRDMGWFPSTALPKSQVKKVDDSVVEQYGTVYSASEMNVVFKRYTQPGYSNIPLRIVHDKAANLNVFANIPASYTVSSGLLTELYNRWKHLLSNTGRHFIAISSEEYRSLRSNYLHYSGNSSIVNSDKNSKVVNGHEIVDIGNNRKLITRRIFSGVSNVKCHYFLHDISAATIPPTTIKK